MDEDPDEQDAPGPDPWLAFDQAVRDRHGVADATLAAMHGVTRSRFHRRTDRESWRTPRDGVRLHPHVPDSVQQRLTVVTVRTAGLAAASPDTAAWLHGLLTRPPSAQTIALAQPYRADRHRDVRIHRARWLTPDDVVEVQGVPTLSVPATFLSSARAAADLQRARLIDVLHRRLAEPADVAGLLDRVGPVPGKGTVRQLVAELGPLVVESIFPQRPPSAGRVRRHRLGAGAHRPARLARGSGPRARQLDAAIEAQRGRGVGRDHPSPRRR